MSLKVQNLGIPLTQIPPDPLLHILVRHELGHARTAEDERRGEWPMKVGERDLREPVPSLSVEESTGGIGVVVSPDEGECDYEDERRPTELVM